MLKDKKIIIYVIHIYLYMEYIDYVYRSLSDHVVINFHSSPMVQQVGGFLSVHQFPPPIKLTATI